MKIIFILPYFGNFPNYFQLFLNSCKYNPNIHWLIISDNKQSYHYPDNVTLKYMQFQDLHQIIQNKFDFKICLSRPYKLCDYRPAYGYIFEEEIEDFDFWGYCDLDVIFGDLELFLTEDLLRKYDKIGDLGHMTVCKNSKEINRLFMSKTHNEFLYKKVFQNDNNYIFDERYKESINNIFIEQKMRIYSSNICADIYTKSSNFRNVYYNEEHEKIIENTAALLYVWNHGKLKRYKELDQELIVEEFAYIHLQKRDMKVNISLNDDCYKIIPNSFDGYNCSDLNLEKFRMEKKKHFNLFYFKIRTKNFKYKIRKIIQKVPV